MRQSGKRALMGLFFSWTLRMAACRVGLILGTMKWALPTIFAAAVLGAVSPARGDGVVAGSEAPPQASARPEREVLRGHRFLHPSLQDTALIGTHVGITEGGMLLSVDDLPVGRFGEQDLSMIGFQQTLEFAVGVTDWLGIHLDGRGSLLTGRDVKSLLFKVGSFEAEADLSLAIRLLRREASGTQITLRAGGGLGTAKDLSVMPLLENALDAPARTVGSIADGELGELLQVPVGTRRAEVGLYLAQAFSPGFSLQASLAAERGWRTEQPYDTEAKARVDRTSRSLKGSAAIALTYDFNAHRVPVALLGEYRASFGRREGTTFLGETIRVQTASLGLYFTGEPGLQLGLAAATRFRSDRLLGFDEDGNIRSSAPPQAVFGQLSLRHLW